MSLSIFKRQNVVGLDIGHSNIRVVELERSGDSWNVVRAASLPTPKDCVRDGVVIDPQATAFAVKQCLREAGVSATGVHIAVAGGTVVVRNVRMPSMSEATLRKSIQFEAGRYVPTSIEDSYIEFEILGQREENQMDVLIVAAPKDIVKSRMAACKAAGLNVESVDVEVFASYRSLIEASDLEDWNEKTLALVDIGSSTTHVSVIQNGAFAMTRTINQGGTLLSDALKNYFKLSEEDAENGKASLDLRELLDDSKPMENPPLRVMQPHIDDLVREVRRSLNYFQSQQQDASQSKNIDGVLVTGGGAQLTGLPEYMSAKLHIPTAAKGVFDSPKVLSPEEDFDGMGWGVALGLAMRTFSRGARAKAA